MAFPDLPVYSESLSERYNVQTPVSGTDSGAGEYIHGANYGKLLIRILMFGAIPQQGIHHIPEGTDLLFAILYAGGYSNETKLNGIAIRRRDVKELMIVDLEDLIEDGKPIPKLMDGDIVNIPFNWRRDWADFQFITSMFVSVSTLLLSIYAVTK